MTQAQLVARARSVTLGHRDRAQDTATHRRELSLGRDRVLLLPTRAGYAYVLTVLVMLAGSVNYNNALGYLLTFVLVSLALVSMVHTYRNVAGLSLTGRRSPPVFAGEAARFALTVDNRGGPCREGLVVRERRRDDEAVVALDLEADAAARVSLSVPAPRRGLLRLPQVCVASRAPFGVFRAWSTVRLDLETLVYPTPRGRQPLPLAASRGRDERGLGATGRDDFAGLRDYRPGDSPRRIHWKAATRDDTLPVKQFAGNVATDLALRFDRVKATDLESRLSQLCAWILEADAQGLRYGLQLPGLRIASGTGADHRRDCLEHLARFQAGR